MDATETAIAGCVPEMQKPVLEQSGRTDTEFEKKFWLRVNKNGAIPVQCPHLGQCWTVPKVHGSGYGQICWNHKVILYHRASWQIHFGDPGKLFVCHRCDVRNCVRPSHLFLGTQAQNMADCARKKRHTYGETSSLSKLKNLDVLAIRWLLKNGRIGAQVAKQFGVTKDTVYAIRDKKSWGDLEG